MIWDENGEVGPDHQLTDDELDEIEAFFAENP
jgi:hypothetical protein